MTTGGWIFMVASIVFVTGLTSYCFYRVLTAPKDIQEPPATLGG